MSNSAIDRRVLWSQSPEFAKDWAEGGERAARTISTWLPAETELLAEEKVEKACK